MSLPTATGKNLISRGNNIDYSKNETAKLVDVIIELVTRLQAEQAEAKAYLQRYNRIERELEKVLSKQNGGDGE